MKHECYNENEIVKKVISKTPDAPIVTYVDCFSFQHFNLLRGGELSVLIMRPYEFSLEDFLNAHQGHHDLIDCKFVLKIFHVIIQAGAAFERAEYCHGDIKVYFNVVNLFKSLAC